MVRPDSNSTTSFQLDDPHADYRTVEPWAVAGVILGLLSALALLGGVLWLVAGVAIVVNLVALARMARDLQRGGRTAALVGLALSITFAVTPVVRHATSWLLLSRQARPVADQFFEYLREDRPEAAMLMRAAPDLRQRYLQAPWVFFRNDAEGRGQLRAFVSNPTTRALLALGKRADVRYYRTDAVATERDRGMASFLYTVTYNDADDRKTTFLVSVVLERKPTQDPAANPWRVVDVVGGIDPRGTR